MSGSNRLLDMFHFEVIKGRSLERSCSLSVGVAPSHGMITAEQMGGIQHRRGGLRKGRTSLQRENERLREQLKFQGAVIDQLAGDVHNLESSAVAVRASREQSTTSREATAFGKTPVAYTLGASKRAVDDVQNSAVEQKTYLAELKSENRDARERAEGLRHRIAVEREKAAESKKVHVELLSRERKFRAAVEAGLREKVHSTRRRSRDTEELLSTELAFVKTQLKEAIDFLVNKEEEACLANEGKVKQERLATEAWAKLKERDRRVQWLERRLSEVSAGEASVAKRCMEEMTASVVAQQRELELLRATATTEAQSQTQQRDYSNRAPNTIQNGGVQDHVAGAAASPEEGYLVTECLPTPGMPKSNSTTDPNASLTPFLRGDGCCPQDISSVAVPELAVESSHEGQKHQVRTDQSQTMHRDTQRTPVLLVHQCVGTDEPLSVVARAIPSSEGADRRGMASNSNAPDGASSELCRSGQMRDMLEWLLAPADDSQRQRQPQSLPPTLVPYILYRGDLEKLRDDVLAVFATKIEDAVREVVSQERGGVEQRIRGLEEREAAWQEREKGFEEELASLRVQSGDWEKEAVALRIERQAVLRRLRTAETNAADKGAAVTDNLDSIARLTAQVDACRGATKGLRRELTLQKHARRALEKRAKSAEVSLASAISARKKLERAKTLLKARLAGAIPRTRDATCQTLNSVHRRETGTRFEECAENAQEEIQGTDADGGVDRQLHAGRLEAQLKASQVEKEHARQDAEKAQTRVETAHEAWQGLAEKVVSLADRNADLERIILHLQQEVSAITRSCSCCMTVTE